MVMDTRTEDTDSTAAIGATAPAHREIAPTLFVPTKLARPPLRPGAVARSRLLDRLADIEHSPLTLVSAAAGFGKTTLLTAWAATYSGPIAWVGLDPEDNDPARFWRYVASGARDRAGQRGGRYPRPVASATTAARRGARGQPHRGRVAPCRRAPSWSWTTTT